jgi:hypothetical protein
LKVASLNVPLPFESQALKLAYLLAPNNERDQDFRLSPIYEGSCGHKKEPKQFTYLGFGSLLPQSGFFSWAAGVGGWGAAQLGL